MEKQSKDLYIYFLELSWRQLLFHIAILYLCTNLAFAILFYIFPNSINGMDQSFLTCFFFSIQTLSTIGYGALSPTGTVSNIIVTIEAAFGLLGVALITGVVFSKIARPYAKIRFSKNIILSKFNNEYCLSFRIGNIRGNDIVQAKVNVSALINETTPEGEKIRKVYDLPLRRSENPFFKFSWSIFHPINEMSPLLNFDESIKNLMSIVVTVIGHDGSFSSTVYSRYSYHPEDIIKDQYFEDILIDNMDGSVAISYEKFDQLK